MRSQRIAWPGGALVIIISIGLGSCARPSPTPSPDAVASYDGGEITDSDVEAYLGELPAGRRVAPLGADPTTWRRRQIERVFLRRLVVTDDAIEELAADSGFAAEVAAATKGALARAYLAQHNAQLQVTRAELESTFEQHREQFVRPELRSFRNVTVALPGTASPNEIAEARQRARRIRERILDGEAVEDVAREVSESANAGAGGLVPPVARDALQDEIARVVFGLDVGEVSELVENKTGLHIFELVSIRPADPPDIERHLPRVAEAVLLEKRAAYYDQLVEAALADGGWKMPTWPEIDDPDDFDAAMVLFAVPGAEVRASDVLRTARQQAIPAPVALHRLVGDAVLAAVFADHRPEDAARIEDGVRRKLASSTIEGRALRDFVESLPADRLESFYNEHRERFLTDVQIELTRFSWPIDPAHPSLSLDDAARFAAALKRAPEDARVLWEEAAESGAVRRGYPLMALSVIATAQPGLVRNLGDDPAPGAVIGPTRSAGQFDVIKIETVVPSRLLSFAEARARIPAEMLKSERAALVDEWIAELTDEHELRILEDQVAAADPQPGETTEDDPVS